MQLPVQNWNGSLSFSGTNQFVFASDAHPGASPERSLDMGHLPLTFVIFSCCALLRAKLRAPEPIRYLQHVLRLRNANRPHSLAATDCYSPYCVICCARAIKQCFVNYERLRYPSDALT